MAERVTRDMQNLIDAIALSMKLDRSAAIEQYLLCGMAQGYNYNGRLTPKIFFDNFYVKPNNLNPIRTNALVRRNYNKAIDALLSCLNSEKENFVILSGPAGSGKSTFITGFSEIVNKMPFRKCKAEGTIQTIRMDCAFNSGGLSYNDISMKFPMEQLIHAYNDYYAELENDISRKWREKYDWVLWTLLNNAYQYKNTDRGYTGSFITFLQANEISSASRSRAWVNGTSRKTIEIEDRHHAISLLFLMLSCKIAVTGDHEKYIVFFDNLEMYIYHTDQPIFGYVSIAKNIYNLFSELPHILGSDINPVFTSKGYMTHFTIALCLRTSTRSEDTDSLPPDGVPNQWSNDAVREIDLPIYDFSPLAIQNKLRFLQEHDALKPYFSDVHSYVNPLYDINVEKPIDDEVASFSSNYYFPFNNCNYRIVIITLEEIAKYSKELVNLDKILTIVESDPAQSRSDIIYYVKNGKRMIATRSRYEFLHDQNYLDQLGIADFSAEHRQSNVRAVLNYIFFKSTCDRGYFGRSGTVSLLDLMRDVRLIPHTPIKFKDIADVVIALGPISCNKIREEALRKWGALINISGIASSRNISEELKYALSDETYAARIQLSLTPAGRDYVLNESKQFEYFLFRITDSQRNRQYKPLFSYLEFENAQKGLQAIHHVYLSIASYAEDFTMDCPSSVNCELNDCKECFAKNPTLCMTVIRAFDFFSIIRQHIDYIDRYRCVLIANLLHTVNHHQNGFAANFADIVKINNNLIDLLAKFLGLYDRMEERLTAFEMNHGSLFNHILDIAPRIAEKIDSNDIMPYYHLPSGNNILTNLFRKDNPNLIDVLDMAKRINCGHTEEPTKRLYQIMDEVYRKRLNDLRR